MFLDEKNPLRRTTMYAIAREAHRRTEVRDHNLAAKIVNGVANLFTNS